MVAAEVDFLFHRRLRLLTGTEASAPVIWFGAKTRIEHVGYTSAARWNSGSELGQKISVMCDTGRGAVWITMNLCF